MRNWSGKKVVILGAARQGTALARYLARHGAQVVLNDRRSAKELEEVRASLAESGDTIEWVLGQHPLEILDGADLVCPSGGIPLTIPLVVEARRRGLPLSNDSQIFLEAVPCRVIGITGSAGKTTTTTLVGRMAQVAAGDVLAQPVFHRAWIGGNIGSPLITELDDMHADDLAVMELSSFQLELMDVSPQIAAILNITPNHLDRHGSMPAYTAAKARILQFQSADGLAVLGRDDMGAWGLAGQVQGRLLSFGFQAPRAGSGTYLRGDQLILRRDGQEEVLLDRSAIQLRGKHNLLNVLAACAIAAAAGLPVRAMQSGVQDFRGVPHRLEFVRTWRGAAWYNDSIATAPERSMAAIRSFDEPLVLLAGGRDKDLPWDDFAALALRRVDHLVIFGEAAPKILQALELASTFPGARTDVTVARCQGLREAVAEAARIMQQGDVVLLSPGGTSFDEFVDFEERGECFRQLVMNL